MDVPSTPLGGYDTASGQFRAPIPCRPKSRAAVLVVARTLGRVDRRCCWWRVRGDFVEMPNPKEVEKDQYQEFYKKTFNKFLDPLSYTHFTTEGEVEVEFRSVLYRNGTS